MKRCPFFVLLVSASLLTLFGAVRVKADAVKNLPLVFDPITKKYFIGGSAKFTLKQGGESSLIDRIEISVDGGEYRPYGEAIEFKTEGKHAIKFRAVNPVNNWSPVQFIEVFADLASPTSEATFAETKFFQEAAIRYVALNSTITLSSQDSLSGVASVEMSWDGTNFTPYTKPVVVEKPGPQALHFRSIDRVGNVEPTRKVEFFADGAAPVSEVKLVGTSKPTVINGKNFLSDSVAYAVTAGDDSAKVKETWVVLDGGKPQPYVKPLYFLQEGPHVLTYYSVDNVGNKEPPKSMSMYTVSIPPHTVATPVGKVVNTGGINYAKSDFQLKLDAKDNVVGLDHIEVKLDQDTDFKPYLEAIRFSIKGLHTISYRSVDRAGNVEPAKVYNVNILEAAPETSLATAQPIIVRDGVTYSPAPNVLTFNVSNSSVGVKQTLVSIDDGPFMPYQGPLTLNADRKVHKISYKSLDKLDNEETAKVAVYHMIGSVPVVDLFVGDGKSSDEQVRTNFLEQPAGGGAAPERALASPGGKTSR